MSTELHDRTIVIHSVTELKAKINCPGQEGADSAK